MNSLTDVIGNLEGGRTLERLNDKLVDVVTAVLQHRKEGEISISLKIKPNGETAVSVTTTVKVKTPEAATAVTTFFADEHGNLLRRDPRQRTLPFREVADAETGELREVPA